MSSETASIRAEAARRNETSADIAAALGIQRNVARNRLAGRTRWTLPEVIALADHWNMTVDEVLGRTGVLPDADPIVKRVSA